ncbi:MAG TPA: phosphatidylglycerophosphatase A [Pyrinomonadaceae bacterium]|nr:phosphatidylglycerophosphatase A [Pyrinomonadaceae bacterium]
MPIIKESSDELNPPEVRAGEVPPRTSRSAADYLALAVATCGVGYLPLAPGTWGSVVGVLLYLVFEALMQRAYALISYKGFDAATLYLLRTIPFVLLISAITLAGIWAATRTERLLRRKDPGIVVVDEVAGQLLAFVFIPTKASAWVIVAGFVLFRLFDIWKPYPVRRLEGLESGLGIMGDDVLAGIYAAITLGLVWLIAVLG